ncbi:MAG: MFS family permease [Chloroflexi bacterium]|nr:MAG: MFS family permease [Chloroflexota bacterium]
MMIARGWLVLEMTDSAFLVTATQAASMLPQLFTSLIGGFLADRFNRKKIIIFAELFNMSTLIVLSLLVITNVVEVWQIFVLSFMGGITFSMGFLARTSLVPSLVERNDMTSAVALFTTVFSAGQLIGPAIAGVLIESLGMGVTFLSSALVLIVALLILVPLKTISSGAPNGDTNRVAFIQSVAEGFSYVKKSNLVLGLMMLGLGATLFGFPFMSILPVFARDVLDVGANGLGWLAAMQGVGALIGSIIVASMRSHSQIKILTVAGSLGLPIFILLFALSSTYALSIALVIILGFFFQVFMTSNFTQVQIVVPDAIRGRVLSIRMIIFGIGPIGMIALGTVAELIGTVVATAAMGVIGFIFLSITIALFPALRKTESERS